MPLRKPVLMALDKFQALLDPARHIPADVEQHAQLGVAAVQQSAVQLLAGGFALRQ